MVQNVHGLDRRSRGRNKNKRCDLMLRNKARGGTHNTRLHFAAVTLPGEGSGKIQCTPNCTHDQWLFPALECVSLLFTDIARLSRTQVGMFIPLNSTYNVNGFAQRTILCAPGCYSAAPLLPRVAFVNRKGIIKIVVSVVNDTCSPIGDTKEDFRENESLEIFLCRLS